MHIAKYPNLKISIYDFSEYLELTSGSIHLIDTSFWVGLKIKELLHYKESLLDHACILEETIKEASSSTTEYIKQNFKYKEDLLLDFKSMNSNASFNNSCPLGDSHDKLITSSAKYYNGIIDTKDEKDIVINACSLGVECGIPVLPHEQEIINNEGEEAFIGQFILKLDEKINKLTKQI